jgi:hypothetical protein
MKNENVFFISIIIDYLHISIIVYKPQATPVKLKVCTVLK